MDDNGNTKDDVPIPDGEIGTKIRSLFDDGKDTSTFIYSYFFLIFSH